MELPFDKLRERNNQARPSTGSGNETTKQALRQAQGTRQSNRPFDKLKERGWGYFFFSLVSPVDSAATKASWGTSTRPMVFMRFLPSFCFSSSLRLRVMSPP